MNDWFEWNDVRCTEYGIHMLEQPVLTLPNERATFVDVPGRSGSLTVLEGDAVYDDLVLTAQCMVENLERYEEIASYLRGSGRVTFANRPEGYYEARIVNQIPFEKILRGNPHRSFAVNFRCKPFWYVDSGTTGMNNAMSGDFPILLPGANAISWAGNVSRVVVEPHWRYL